MNDEGLNDSNVDETVFLNGISNDPPLDAVHVGTDNGPNGPGLNDRVENEQMSIQDGSYCATIGKPRCSPL